MIVTGSISWRFPLAVQIIPGVLLGFGSLWLPQSPRLEILRGDFHSGWKTLRNIRCPIATDREDEGLQRLIKVRSFRCQQLECDLTRFQLEALEIQVESQLVQNVEQDLSQGGSWLRKEYEQWKLLLKPQYRQRVLVGVTVMVFQRLSIVQ